MIYGGTPQSSDDDDAHMEFMGRINAALQPAPGEKEAK